MKSFLSEYGFAILASIVVIVLILMASPVGTIVKNAMLETVENFAEVTETAHESMGEKLSEQLQQLSAQDEQPEDESWYLGVWYKFGGSSVITLREDGTVYIYYTNYPDEITDTYEVSEDGQRITFLGETYLSDGKGHLIAEGWEPGTYYALNLLTRFPNIQHYWAHDLFYSFTLSTTNYMRTFELDENEIILYEFNEGNRFFYNENSDRIEEYENGMKIREYERADDGLR